MTQTADHKIERHTPNDLALAKLYFPILVDLAINKRQLTYKGLIDEAKRLNPENEELKSAIPVSTGRKLACIQMFCRQNELPTLPVLIVNKDSGLVGEGFYDLKDVQDANTEQDRVYNFDWSKFKIEFDGYISHAQKKITPKVRRTEPDALKLMGEYYKLNREKISPSAGAFRSSILTKLIEGESVEDAFIEVFDIP